MHILSYLLFLRNITIIVPATCPDGKYASDGECSSKFYIFNFFSVCFSSSIFLSICNFVFLPFCLSLSFLLFFSVSLSPFLSFSLSFSRSISLALFLSLSLSLFSLYLFLCRSLGVYPYLFIYLSLCFSLCLRFRLFISICPSVALEDCYVDMTCLFVYFQPAMCRIVSYALLQQIAPNATKLNLLIITCVQVSSHSYISYASKRYSDGVVSASLMF